MADVNIGGASNRVELVPPERSTFTLSTLHRYTYAGNDPVNNIDPTGQSFAETFAVVHAWSMLHTREINIASFGVCFAAGFALPDNVNRAIDFISTTSGAINIGIPASEIAGQRTGSKLKTGILRSAVQKAVTLLEEFIGSTATEAERAFAEMGLIQKLVGRPAVGTAGKLWGLPQDTARGVEGTLSKLVIQGQEFFGVNGMKRLYSINPTNLPPQMLGHAECDAFDLARQSGIRDAVEAVIYINRPPCFYCGFEAEYKQGLIHLAKQFNLQRLKVVYENDGLGSAITEYLLDIL